MPASLTKRRCLSCQFFPACCAVHDITQSASATREKQQLDPVEAFSTTKEILDFSCFLAWRGVPGVELSPLSSAFLFRGLSEANEAFSNGRVFQTSGKERFFPFTFSSFLKHNKHPLESIVSLAHCPLEGYANRQAHNSLAAAGRDRPRSLAQLQNSKNQTYKKLSQNCLLAWSEREERREAELSFVCAWFGFRGICRCRFWFPSFLFFTTRAQLQLQVRSVFVPSYTPLVGLLFF